MSDPIQLQKQYYARTANEYASIHGGEPEHDLALGIFASSIRFYDGKSVLDVGCGTGRVLRFLQSSAPDLEVRGIEPVPELRQKAYEAGVSKTILTEGDATALSFPSNSFDFVCSFGVMHHLRNPRVAIAEMLRVSRIGVFISDTNCFGCGSLPSRLIRQSINALGLWKAVQWGLTGGKFYKISEGDGVHYSYSLFNDLPFLARHSETLHVMNTLGRGINIYRDCSHLAALAIKEAPQHRSQFLSN